MPRSAPFSPFQLISPIQLFICLILFFLPWVEVQCVPDLDQVKGLPKAQVEKAKTEYGIDPSKPFSIARQSGLQIATGDVAPGSDMKRIQSKMKEQLTKSGMAVNETSSSSKSNKKDGETKAAPLLFLFPLLVVAGMGIAFIPLPALIRRLLVAGCCMGALGTVGLQAAIGFPIEDDLRNMKTSMPGIGPGMRPRVGGNDAKDKSDKAMRLSMQIPFYLTIILLLGAGATAFLDAMTGGSGSQKYGSRRRRPRHDYDDEDDEDYRPRARRRRVADDDDRPRKKRRNEDDEDDDPPRKKPAAPAPAFEVVEDLPPLPLPPNSAPAARASDNAFDFDDEPKPKKKQRSRDDDDDDDRPRKKRRRDDD